jgi:hypothetical protein
MTAEITIPVSFYKLSAFPAIKNCEKCHFGKMNLCLTDIKGLREKCCYGQRGYYQFDGEPEGSINE